jgi:energy-coupling factor transport system permease protein
VIAESFIAGKGPLYQFDPRPKFIILISLVILFLVETNLIIQGGMIIFISILTGISLGYRRIFKPLRSILPIIILTAVLTPPFNTEGEALLRFGERVILSSSGLYLTAGLILRFTGITAAFYLFFSTTETASFILALRAFGMPFRAALTVTISLRYIPDMFSTYGRISDAHKLRTAGIARKGRRKGFLHRFNNLFPVLISVLIHAVKSIPALAMALDSKGFGRNNPRSSCRKLVSWHMIAGQLLIGGLLLVLLIGVSVKW